MQIIKPMRLGVLTKCYREPARNHLFVAIIGFFDLREPSDFLPEATMWPVVMKELPPGALFDMAMPKPQGEVLVAGRAMSPDGEPVREMAVGVRLGSVRKALHVVGDRRWRFHEDGAIFTEALPFVDMPLTYERAFGGPGFAVNPAGRGFDARRRMQARQDALLPNIEAPGQRILSIDDRPEPAGLAPLDIMAPSRQARAGTYDMAWLAARHPALAEDCDWRIFNAAPEDQWIDGFFAGDETFEVVGMSARHPYLKGHLPAMRARCFVSRRIDDGVELTELTPRIDTVWLFGSAHRGAVIYRAAARIEDVDGTDIADIMLAYERMADAPRPIEHYRKVHRLRSDPATKALYAFSESQLAPMPFPEEQAERQAARDAAAAAALAKQNALLARQHRKMIEKSGLPAGMFPPPPKAEPSPFPTITKDDIARMDFDLAGMLKAADEMTAELKAKAEGMKGEVDKLLAGHRPVIDFAKLGAAADLPPDSEAARLQAAMAKALSPDALDDELADLPAALREDARQALATAQASRHAAPSADEIAVLKRTVRAKALGLPDPSSPLAEARRMIEGTAISASAPDLSDGPPEFRNIAASALARPEAAPKTTDRTAVEALLQEIGLSNGPAAASGDPAAPQVDPARRAAIEAELGQAMPGLAGPDGKVGLGAVVGALAAAEARHPPAGDPARAKADALAKLDAANAALGPGIAKARRLSPVPIDPAEPLPAEVATYLGMIALEELRAGRSLAGRDLAGADLAGQNLSGIDLTGALLESADLRNAVLADAILEDVALTGARLDGADLRRARLARANLSKASMCGALLTEADLAGAQLIETDFSKADLGGVTFTGPMAMKTRFTGARLDGARCANGMFVEADFAGASLADARFANCMFITTNLSRVKAPRARLTRCSFTQVTAENADFTGAALPRCAAVPGTSFAQSVFHGASAQKSSWQGVDLTACDFRDARLDEVNFGEAMLRGARFSWASLRRAVLAGADLEEADLTGADLFEALLRRTRLLRASLRGANLYSANLDDAALELTDLTDANLAKTHLLRATNGD